MPPTPEVAFGVAERAIAKVGVGPMNEARALAVQEALARVEFARLVVEYARFVAELEQRTRGLEGDGQRLLEAQKDVDEWMDR